MQYKEASVVEEDPEGTVREETQVTSGGGLSPDSSTQVVRRLTPVRRWIELIYLVFGIVDVVLLTRMVLKVLAANPHAGFTSFVYAVSDALLIPFRCLRQRHSSWCEIAAMLDRICRSAFAAYRKASGYGRVDSMAAAEHLRNF